MYKKLKIKLKKLFSKETPAQKYEEILKKFSEKKEKLKNKRNNDSIEEILIINKLISKVEKKIEREKVICTI